MKHGTAILIIVLACQSSCKPPPTHSSPARCIASGTYQFRPGNYETDTHNCPIGGTPYWQSTMIGLRERGYVQDRNLVIECR